MRNSINPIPQGATHMDKHGNYYCAGDTCVWGIWDPLSNQWVSTEMSDDFIQTSMYRVISVPDYQKELNDKYNNGHEAAVEANKKS